MSDSQESIEPTDTAAELELDIEEQTADLLKAKIISVLRTYPIISPSMLQVAIGPNTPPRFWKPLLQELLTEGQVLAAELVVRTPSGQFRMAKTLRLPGTPLNWVEIMAAFTDGRWIPAPIVTTGTTGTTSTVYAPSSDPV